MSMELMTHSLQKKARIGDIVRSRQVILVLNLLRKLLDYIRTKKDSDKDAAFSAESLSLGHVPSTRFRLLGYILVVIPIIFIGWASLVDVEVNINATGSLVPQSRIKVVQAFDAGVVKKINARNGDKVNAGDVLVELDKNVIDAELSSLHQEYEVSMVNISILAALYEQPLAPRSVWKRPLYITDAVLDVFLPSMDMRSLSYKDTLEVLRHEGQVIEAEIGVIKSLINKITSTLEIFERRLNSKQQLFLKGLVSEMELLELEERQVSDQHEVKVQEARLKELNEQLKNNLLKQNKFESEFKLKVATELITARSGLKTIEAGLPPGEYRRSLTTIFAPVSGTVEQSVLRAEGQVVQAAEQVMVIVPESEKLIMEIKVLNKDIGFVRVNQKVDVRIDAFQFTKYGSLSSEILEISTDAVETPDLGFVYIVRAKLDADSINIEGKEVPLSSGMSGTVAIKVGKRRIIEFILAPLLRYRETAFREI